MQVTNWAQSTFSSALTEMLLLMLLDLFAPDKINEVFFSFIFSFSFHQDYLELAKDASSLLCSTDKPFEIVFDSEGLPEKEEEEKEKPQQQVWQFFWASLKCHQRGRRVAEPNQKFSLPDIWNLFYFLAVLVT